MAMPPSQNDLSNSQLSVILLNLFHNHIIVFYYALKLVTAQKDVSNYQIIKCPVIS